MSPFSESIKGFFSNSPQSRKHVFISFKTEEQEFANLLHKALIQEEFSVWWQEDLQISQEWHGEIDKAIQDAGSVVVVWSKLSVTSQWVKHEASQAIVKGIYVPIKKEQIEIESPYNRFQALDMFHWQGNTTDPGFQNLVNLLKRLMPKPLTIEEQIKRFVWTQRAALLLSIIATLAFYLLISQRQQLQAQLDTLNTLFKNTEKQSAVAQLQLKKQDNLPKDVSTQIKKQDSLVNDVRSQTQKQDGLIKDVRRQSNILKLQANNQDHILTNVQSALQSINSIKYPLDSIKLSVFLKEGSSNGLQNTLYGEIILIDTLTYLNNQQMYIYTDNVFWDKILNLTMPYSNIDPYELLANFTPYTARYDVKNTSTSSFTLNYLFSSAMRRSARIKEQYDLADKIVLIRLRSKLWKNAPDVVGVRIHTDFDRLVEKQAGMIISADGVSQSFGDHVIFKGKTRLMLRK